MTIAGHAYGNRYDENRTDLGQEEEEERERLV